MTTIAVMEKEKRRDEMTITINGKTYYGEEGDAMAMAFLKEAMEPEDHWKPEQDIPYPPDNYEDE